MADITLIRDATMRGLRITSHTKEPVAFIERYTWFGKRKITPLHSVIIKDRVFMHTDLRVCGK